MDEQGLTAPTTVEELENILTVFNEKYNGAFYAAAANRGAAAWCSGFDAFTDWNGNRLFVDTDNVIQYANVQPEFRDYLETMNKWYESGLMDPNFATANDAYMKQITVEEKTGLSYSAISQQTEWLNGAAAAGLDADWVGFPELVGKDGIAHYIQTEYSTFTGSCGAYITNACDTEEELKARFQGK